MSRAAASGPLWSALVRAIVLLALVMLASACSGPPRAPIVDHSKPGSSLAAPSYRVLRGDTLFSIAFRYGLDYRRLAAANGISAPYRIYAGQALRLAEADIPRAATSTASKASPGTKPAPAPATGTVTQARNDTPRAVPVPAASRPGTSQATRKAPPASPALVVDRPVSSWRWPGKGRLTRRFDGARHKGVDIDGSRGDAVLATAPGRVVYAGSGIAGYGLLLIVRHNEEYLSAYGHNDVLLVDEGDAVAAQQQVARMGSSGTDRVKLHFELRRNGRPVDPLRLLPSR